MLLVWRHWRWSHAGAPDLDRRVGDAEPLASAVSVAVQNLSSLRCPATTWDLVERVVGAAISTWPATVVVSPDRSPRR